MAENSGTKVDEFETSEARIERLGRERPEKFKSSWAEAGFVFSVVMSQVLTVRRPLYTRMNCSS